MDLDTATDKPMPKASAQLTGSKSIKIEARGQSEAAGVFFNYGQKLPLLTN